MRWTKQGLIFAPDMGLHWSASHAQFPVLDPVGDGRSRIYFATRDKHNRSMPTFLDVAAGEPRQIHYIHDRPVLGLGELGCFDDSGVIPAWIVNREGLKFLYYVGINVGATVPYRNAIGLAVSSDGGHTFERAFQGPVLDRLAAEPHLCTSPCVLVEDGVWNMWYASGIKWTVIGGKPEPFYNIRHAQSADGVRWERPGRIAIDLLPDEGGIGRASVLFDRSLYRMWFSVRGGSAYASNKEHAYRIRYAESSDGLNWTRKSEAAGVNVALEGWDSEMVAYPFVYQSQTGFSMLYNGNGFGRTGFGYATAER